jgi:quercetin dioxygenase-like cupin family protein
MITQPSTIYNPVTSQQLTFVAASQQELIIEASYGAGSKEPLPHYHPMQEEYFEVVSGQLTVRLNNQLSTLCPGDTLHIPPGSVHSMWNAAVYPATVHWTTRPALRTEEFHRVIFALAESGQVDAEGVPGLLLVSLLTKEFDHEFRLAKPPRWIQQAVFGLLRPLARAKGLQTICRQY